MESIFTESARQFGLPVGLLLVAVVILGRIVAKQYAEGRAQLFKEIEETKAERDFYRDKWLETLQAAEVGQEAAKRLAGGRRPSGGR